jgi:ATP-dependent Clp protease ATP-binding subunit ClpA
MESKYIDNIIQNAVTFAKDKEHEYVTIEHIMFCLLENEEIVSLVKEMRVDLNNIVEDLNQYLDDPDLNGLENEHGVKGDPKKTVSTERIIQRALAQVIFSGREEVKPLDMFLSILSEPNSHAAYFCQLNGLDKNLIVEFLEHKYTSDQSQELVKEYTTNLNEEAQKGKIDNLIGRHMEVDELVHILARRKKNNVVLVGEPGTGKTAVAEGLAKRIVDGDVPDVIKNKVIYSLAVGDLLAGTRYRGDFEERFKSVLETLEASPHAVLFIDEIHMIMGAGSAGGSSVDIANMIKPVLGKGRLLTIGATTPDEFADSFEKDRALMRRFAKLDIIETNVEDTKEIVKGLNTYYEDFHKVKYSEDILEKSVDLCHRYIKNKAFPDKALDVVDAAGAKVKLRGGDDVTLKDVIHVISKISNVGVDVIDIESVDTYKNLDTRIKTTVFGQDEAVDKIVENIVVSKSGLREKNKPIGSFLLVGPTGTGKTETAKTLAKELECKLVKFDMSEYMEKHSVSKLIGAPPGYVGHAEGKLGQGLMLAEVEENPNCVLLLDEVEKAAPEVLQVLLQVMDDGRLTGSTGKEVDFSNVILLMTSNLGATDAEGLKIGFGDQTKLKAVDKAVEKFFSPEFRNRLDATIKFNKLAKELMLLIVDRLVTETNELLGENESTVTISITEACRLRLADDGYEPSMGARPLKRVFEDNIKKPLSKKILFEDLSNVNISVDIQNNEYVFVV